MVRTIQLIAGLVMLILLEILKVYFIMPFPGSQRSETIAIAYFIHDNIFYLRIIGWLLILFPILHFFSKGKMRVRILTGLGLVIYFCVFYMFNYRFLADRMFYQPQNTIFASSDSNNINENSLILGVNINNEAKAYPIEVIGYHHQVRDTIGDVPVMITYCTVCRTGRVYRPEVQGKIGEFRLVGMDHFNAMFEDAFTRSWWRQVNGEAIAGPLKGQVLPEIFSEQMTLRSWLSIHPDTKILQPDTVFTFEYEGLEGFDDGTIESGLEKRDSLSWRDKSWVVGLQLGMHARAYDWNDLLKLKVINDTLAGTAVLVAVEADSASFHVWKRDSLTFVWDVQDSVLRDVNTNSSWNWQGSSTEGPLRGKQLFPLQSYQEFWHSWATFRPQTTRYQPQ